LSLKTLEISGFRNLKKTSLVLGSGESLVLEGPNGHGKTNFLEALYLLSLTKSFRTDQTADLIGFDQPFARVLCELTSGPKIEAILTREPLRRTFKVNGVIKSSKEVVGLFPVVFFSPEDSMLVGGEPGFRRKYLNIQISQVSREYLESLMAYNETLKQRNALLKRIQEGQAKETELEFWDEALVRHGILIAGERQKQIQLLSKFAPSFYQKLSGTKDTLELIYQPSAPLEADAFMKGLRERRQKEIMAGITLIGPHRDELLFNLNERPMAAFGSRGEARTVVLALKYAEIMALKDRKGELPVLLLDDVFSELDPYRQEMLSEHLRGAQTFITTPHKPAFEMKAGSMRTFSMLDGALNAL
jgi:DNA replication and repair protein RecF